MSNSTGNIETVEIDQQEVVVNGSLLSSLSIGLYTEPVDVFRELVQNSTDAYQEANTPVGERRIDINVNRAERTVRVRDYAIGLDESQFMARLLSIGFSHKVNKNLRGFRGIGRFAALGFCKSIVFRSRQAENQPVLEMRLNALSYNNYNEQTIDSLLRENIKIARLSSTNEWPARFFECELEGVINCKNDLLVNPHLISKYLSEKGPVPFHEDFDFRSQIKEILGHELMYEVEIYVNNSQLPITKPHRNQIHHPTNGKLVTQFDRIETISELDEYISANNEHIARGWLLHHQYPGALPKSSLMQGLRVRVGNIQIGSETIFESQFKEARFNSWCVGEIHICDPNIRPNSRRDDIEPSYGFEGLKNAVGVLTHRLTQICREHSRNRHSIRKINHRQLSLPLELYRKILLQTNISEPYPEKVTISKKI